MNPRLVAIAGPLNGSTFALKKEEMTLGRLESNYVVVPDMAVSRQHCAIRREDDGFKLVDLQSRNGCFVNSVPVKEHQLQEGDRLEIGESKFLFQTGAEEHASSGMVELRDDGVIAGQTIVLRREDALYLHPDRLTGSDSPTWQTRDLRALLRVSRAINSGGSLDALAGRLLKLIMEFAPADRGAILLDVGSDGEFQHTASWDRRTGTDSTVQVSRTLVSRVLKASQSLWYKETSQDPRFRDAESSIAASLSTDVLAVPISGSQGAIGVIYLAIGNPAGHFERADLELATGIAGLSGAAFETALTVKRLELENERLQGEIEANYKMVGRSPAMQEVYRLITRLARQGSTVLITGESGTGKELVARALHANGPRSAKPFAAVNCAALVETLFESEIFGHEKGAFTGAVALKKGKIEIAEGGTLFLDEIGEMAFPLQAKLLRVLQEREFERLGGTRMLKTDVRVIVATNRELEKEMKNGTFRQDLFFRLNVVRIHVPCLRERRDDIIPLANHFLSKYCPQAKRRLMTISPEAQKYLKAYDWPGNVRELENAMERAVVMGAEDVVRPEDLPDAIGDAEPAAGGETLFHEAVRQAKKEAIAKALERTGGSVGKAAAMLGLHVNYLHRLISTLGLRPSKPGDEHFDS
jgi:transcriptional regulator with GAF, ATPase, and Fis domain